MAFGVKEIVATLVAGSIFMMIGIYAYSKAGQGVDLLNGGDYINTTHYCSSPGTWNGSDCISGGTLTALPTDYAQNNAVMNNIKANATSGFDLGSIIFIVIAAGGIIGVLWMVFR